MSLAAARSLSLSRSPPASHHFVVPPHRVAHALDWNRDTGRILSLSITRHKIDLAVAAHPGNSCEVQELPSIGLGAETRPRSVQVRTLQHGVAEQLASIVHDWAVCGLLVHWPVQRDGGWCGAPCGRVLFTLDQLAHSKALLNRPVSLWDDENCQPTEDSWGRSRIYARGTETKTCHVASQEQYEPRSVILSDFWRDFRQYHWPHHGVEFFPSAVPHGTSREGSSTSLSRNANARNGSWLVSNAHVYSKPAAV